MSTQTTIGFNKATVVPLPWTEDALPLPFALGNSLSIEDVSKFLTIENFDLWREHISKRERDDWSSNLRTALVHRFFSMEHVGKKEQESSELAYWAFMALRLAKPTRTRYSSVQYKVLEKGEIDVFTVAHPLLTPINAPDSESLNRVGVADLVALKNILPRFIAAARSGPEHLQRAMRYYETAYAQIHDPVIQFLTWAMGIEAVVSSPESPKGRSQLLARIYELLDGGAWIYEGSAMNEFGDLPRLSIRDVLPDIFTLRSRLAHGGGWPDWKSDTVRVTLSGERLNYPAILSEASAAVLRKLIIVALASLPQTSNP
jgi:hypothetical protein